MYIYERIKTVRKYFGLSQAQFAQRINRSPGFISNVETGRSEVSDNTIRRICSVFEINKAWLISGTGQMFTEGHAVAEADKETVGARIRVLRKDKKMTQEQFGKAVGYSKVHIHSVEAGKVTPSNEFLKCVSNAFYVSYEWLLTGVGEMEKNLEKAVVDAGLIEWLKNHPEVVKELKIRSGLD